MEKLNKTFIDAQVLSNEELNQMVEKTNELVEASNKVEGIRKAVGFLCGNATFQEGTVLFTSNDAKPGTVITLWIKVPTGTGAVGLFKANGTLIESFGYNSAANAGDGKTADTTISNDFSYAKVINGPVEVVSIVSDRINEKLSEKLSDLASEMESLDEQINGSSEINYSFTATSIEHSSNFDKYPCDYKQGQYLVITLNLGTAITDNNKTQLILFKDDVAKQIFNITIGTEFVINSLAQDIDAIGFYIYKITTLGSFDVTIKTNVSSNSIVGDIEQLKADLNNAKQSLVEEYTFNATTSEHSSNLDKIPFGAKKGDKVTICLSQGTAIIDNKQVRVYFYKGTSALGFYPLTINVPYTIDSLPYDADNIGIYIWEVTQHGTFNVTISKGNTTSLLITSSNDTFKDVTTRNILEQLKRVKVISESTLGNKPLNLLHFSDIHSNQNALKSIMRYLGLYGNLIDDAICTGDCVYENLDEPNSSTRGFDYWTKYGAKKILIAIGNHDCKLSASGYENTPQTTIYNQYISPFVSNWNVTQPSGAETNGLCYYYKDYPTNKVRLIVLDTNPLPLNGDNNKVHFDTIQRQWFIDTLNDARTNGLSVVIAQHYCFKYPSVATRTKNNFDALVSISENSAWSITEDCATIVDSFINAGGEFVCWIAGHTHIDMFSVLESHNNQVIVNVAEANFNDGYYGDIKRIANTPSQDCFNIISIDTSGKTLTLFRDSCNWDRLGRYRHTLCWDYANKKLIHD